MNHRILRRPRTFAIAVECSAMQGYAKQRSYIFVYTLKLIDLPALFAFRSKFVEASRRTTGRREKRTIEKPRPDIHTVKSYRRALSRDANRALNHSSSIRFS
jgi:hypothetical protein